MSRLETTLIVPDCHAPYHDLDAWELMLEAGRRVRPDAVVVMGDLIDCYSVSRHSKDPARATQLDGEVNIARREAGSFFGQTQLLTACTRRPSTCSHLRDQAGDAGYRDL